MEKKDKTEKSEIKNNESNNNNTNINIVVDISKTTNEEQKSENTSSSRITTLPFSDHSQENADRKEQERAYVVVATNEGETENEGVNVEDYGLTLEVDLSVNISDEEYARELVLAANLMALANWEYDDTNDYYNRDCPLQETWGEVDRDVLSGGEVDGDEVDGDELSGDEVDLNEVDPDELAGDEVDPDELAGDEIDLDELSYEELLELGEVVGTESRGLTEDAIASLPSVSYKAGSIQDGSSDLCVICQFEYENGETLTVLSCKHSYHPDCINNWLKINKVCPVCNAEVSTSKNS